MTAYEKTFKEEAVKLSDEIGLAKASEQLGVPYDTLSGWRQKRKKYNEKAHVGNGNKHTQSQSSREKELEKENAELRRANEIDSKIIKAVRQIAGAGYMIPSEMISHVRKIYPRKLYHNYCAKINISRQKMMRLQRKRLNFGINLCYTVS